MPRCGTHRRINIPFSFIAAKQYKRLTKERFCEKIYIIYELIFNSGLGGNISCLFALIAEKK